MLLDWGLKSGSLAKYRDTVGNKNQPYSSYKLVWQSFYRGFSPEDGNGKQLKRHWRLDMWDTTALRSMAGNNASWYFIIKGTSAIMINSSICWPMLKGSKKIPGTWRLARCDRPSVQAMDVRLFVTSTKLYSSHQHRISDVGTLYFRKPIVRQVDLFVETPQRFGAVRDLRSSLACADVPGFNPDRAW